MSCRFPRSPLSALAVSASACSCQYSCCDANDQSGFTKLAKDSAATRGSCLCSKASNSSLVEQPIEIGGAASNACAATVSSGRWNDMASSSAPEPRYFALSKCSKSATSCPAHDGRDEKRGRVPSLTGGVSGSSGMTRSTTHGRNLSAVGLPGTVTHIGTCWQTKDPRAARRGESSGTADFLRSVSSAAENVGSASAVWSSGTSTVKAGSSEPSACLKRWFTNVKKEWDQTTKSQRTV
mmetsp:Transcript_6813/g.17563  ORF Transcript_6813/g.17563 Transcript_6813/m.17563 type:complete len:238 (-) Transcript_6813:754-1467(-)